jgi:O-antigen/teichoic acid export membrane protein
MSDRLILNYFCGEAVVGVYSLSYTFANLFSIFLSNPSGLFWLPFFFSYASKRSIEDTKRLLSRSLIYFFLAGGILYLAITLGIGDVLRIFTSLFASKEGYWHAAKLVPLLTLGPFLYLLSRQGMNALLLVKKPEFTAIAACFVAAANIGLNFLLIPRFGAFGAGLSTVIAYGLYLAIVYGWAQRLFPIKYNIIEIAKSSLFLAVGFIIGWHIRIIQPWASLFAKVIVGVAIFALSIWFISNILTKGERQGLIAFLIDGKRRLAASLLHMS